MKITNLNKFPENYSYHYGSLCSFEEYELRKLEELNLDEIWYWYAQGSYEGMGCLLMRRGDNYDMNDLSHCSCCGPTDRVDFKDGKSLEELEASFSTEYLREYKELIELAKNNK